MNERILHVLEYNKILKQLNNQAATSLGKDLIDAISPSTDYIEVKQLQEETDEAVQIIRLNKVIPLGGIYDIRPSLKRSVIGGLLNTEECLNIASTIYGGRQTKNFIENIEETFPHLERLVDVITPLRELERQINSCIDDHGYVMDNASAKLKGIRSAIRTHETRIREKLDNYIRSQSSMLSDAIVTIRNERSASGETLFMDPKSIVDLNNQLQESALKEKQEIERILRVLSEEIAANEAALNENVKALGKIDFIYARAKLAKKMKAARPKI